jgi:hypothetical protein
VGVVSERFRFGLVAAAFGFSLFFYPLAAPFAGGVLGLRGFPRRSPSSAALAIL